jgi:hypothetical protein
VIGASEGELEPARALRISENLDGGGGISYVVSVGASEQLHLPAVRVARPDGLVTAADTTFRADLYRLIGAVVVAGGHVEAAMKRLLLVLRGDGGAGFSEVDETWTTLTKELSEYARLDGERTGRLATLLDWGTKNRVKERRDNVVHAYWWHFDGIGARRSRFFRKDDGAIMVGSLADLAEDADALFSYAQQLDDLVGPQWPIALLDP